MSIALTVLVPTRNEAENVAPLADRVAAALRGRAWELLFVDDSDDDTPARIARLGDGPLGERAPVRLIHRGKEARRGGLGGAVAAGLGAAGGSWVCVMDADLQHPPEVIPELLAIARTSGADLVMASRYRADGAAGALGGLRLAVSHSTATAARVLFPRRLQAVTDPMSGFFLVRTRLVDPARLRPEGFKILLELVVTHPWLRTAEVPFVFGTRTAGTSKASLQEGLRYLRHLALLRWRAAGRGSAADVVPVRLVRQLVGEVEAAA